MILVAEDPTGHLLTLFPLVFEHHEVIEDNKLGAGKFVVAPLDLWPAKVMEGQILWQNPFVGWIEYAVYYTETVIRWEVFEVGLNWESLGVPSAHVFKNV